MKRTKIGLDVNLGLPRDFSAAVNSDLFSYRDLTNMINAFNAHELDAIFIPAGTLPYLSHYQFISQALMQNNNKDELTTRFVSTKLLNEHDIAKHTIGRVNQYCTTSYWAPLIYLMDYLPKKTQLNFQNTQGFKDLLEKTATAKLDASMVWDIILLENQNLTHKVHTLFSLGGLPTPVIVSHEDFPQEIKEKINQFKSNDDSAFFNSFKPINQKLVDDFQDKMNQTIEFYGLSL